MVGITGAGTQFVQSSRGHSLPSQLDAQSRQGASGAPRPSRVALLVPHTHLVEDQSDVNEMKISVFSQGLKGLSK